MRAVRTHAPERLQIRSCLRCGYRGPELQGERVEQYLLCPSCGEDLCSRPPRSYSELEGLDEGVAWMEWPLGIGSPGRMRDGFRRFLRAVARLFVSRRAR